MAMRVTNVSISERPLRRGRSAVFCTSFHLSSQEITFALRADFRSGGRGGHRTRDIGLQGAWLHHLRFKSCSRSGTTWHLHMTKRANSRCHYLFYFPENQCRARSSTKLSTQFSVRIPKDRCQ